MVLLGPLTLHACGSDHIVAPPEVAHIAFVSQPASGEGQVPLTPAVRVALQDAAGNVVTGASSPVTVTLAAGPSGAILAGTTTVRAVNGIATFDDLGLDLSGEGYVLEARLPGLPAVSSAPVSIRLSFAQVSVGQAHSCGLTTAGFAYCWGTNVSGQLGDGGKAPDRHVPWPVKGGLRFRQLDLGPHHGCATTTDDLAYCWGGNVNGVLGDGTTAERREPTAVAGGLRFVTVSTATFHTCGLTPDGSAYCWGMTFGENSITVRFTPTRVVGSTRFIQLSAGNDHTCAVTADTTAYCWGGNGSGQLGDGTIRGRLDPAPVAGGFKFASVTAGYAYSCGVTEGGTARCWGYGGEGRLGDGTTSSRLNPTPVAGETKFSEVSGGSYWHTCAVSTTSGASCWGYGADGQLGDGTTSARLVPTSVVGTAQFIQISAGVYHTCGVGPDNTAYCWGSNSIGQIGDGTTDQRLVPTAVVR